MAALLLYGWLFWHILQLLLLIHVYQTRRPSFWYPVLILAPIVGGLAYFIIEILPEMLARQRTSYLRLPEVKKVTDKHVSRWEETVEFAPTVENRQHLAEAYAAAGMLDKAFGQIDECLQGPCAGDADLIYRKAALLVQLHRGSEVAAVLGKLPASRTDDGLAHFWQARAHEQADQLTAAAASYQRALPKAVGEEVRWRLASVLERQGEVTRAVQLYREMVANERRVDGRYRKANAQWLSEAKLRLKELGEA